MIIAARKIIANHFDLRVIAPAAILQFVGVTANDPDPPASLNQSRHQARPDIAGCPENSYWTIIS